MLCPIRRGAFTLVEILAVLGILAVLVTLLIPVVSHHIEKSEGTVCAGKLRNLYIAMASSIADENRWPTLPAGIAPNSLQEQKWWLEYSSNNMGLSAKDWQCPTLNRNQLMNPNAQQRNLISYWPAPLDGMMLTEINDTYKDIPWFMENEPAAHGNLTLCVLSDGSVTRFEDLFTNTASQGSVR
jgi:prepilin-type N-terminal cleavage/methylation domain-containing protein